MAESYFQAAADRDADAMASHWHAQGVEDLVPLGPLRGPGAVRSFFAELFAALPAATQAGHQAGEDGQIRRGR